jgi:hypothetical protein
LPQEWTNGHGQMHPTILTNVCTQACMLNLLLTYCKYQDVGKYTFTNQHRNLCKFIQFFHQVRISSKHILLKQLILLFQAMQICLENFFERWTEEQTNVVSNG